MDTVYWTTIGAVSATLGFYFGSRSPQKTLSPIVDEPHVEAVEDILDGDLSALTAGFLEPCKLVLVVRTDIKLADGEVATECGTATLACYRALSKANPKLLCHWERTGQAKIALKGKNEEQLLELETIAKSLNLCARSLKSPLLSQGKDGDRTVLAIGPGPVPIINQVTGKLRLL